MNTSDKDMIASLLGEIRYLLDTGDIRDSERNSRELRDSAASRIGYKDYDEFCRKD